MRISLDPDRTEFVKQVAAVRRHLNANDGVHARLMTASFVPFLAALRLRVLLADRRLP